MNLRDSGPGLLVRSIPVSSTLDGEGFEIDRAAIGLPKYPGVGAYFHCSGSVDWDV